MDDLRFHGLVGSKTNLEPLYMVLQSKGVIFSGKEKINELADILKRNLYSEGEYVLLSPAAMLYTESFHSNPSQLGGYNKYPSAWGMNKDSSVYSAVQENRYSNFFVSLRTSFTATEIMIVEGQYSAGATLLDHNVANGQSNGIVDDNALYVVYFQGASSPSGHVIKVYKANGTLVFQYIFMSSHNTNYSGKFLFQTSTHFFYEFGMEGQKSIYKFHKVTGYVGKVTSLIYPPVTSNDQKTKYVGDEFCLYSWSNRVVKVSFSSGYPEIVGELNLPAVCEILQDNNLELPFIYVGYLNTVGTDKFLSYYKINPTTMEFTVHDTNFKIGTQPPKMLIIEDEYAYVYDAQHYLYIFKTLTQELKIKVNVSGSKLSDYVYSRNSATQYPSIVTFNQDKKGINYYGYSYGSNGSDGYLWRGVGTVFTELNFL